MRSSHPWATLCCCFVVATSLLLFVQRLAGAQDVRAGVEQLAAQLARDTPTGKQLRIAIVDFPDLQGTTSELGRFIASRLTTRLAQSPKFSVVERQRLGQILTELKFAMSDLVDPAKAKQLGRMAGVEALVVGGIADLGNQIDIDARLIDIESTRMLFGTSVTIPKDPTVIAMMERGRVEAPAGGEGHTAPPGSAPPSPGGGGVAVSAGGKGISWEGFVLESRTCRRLDRRIVCDVLFTNSAPQSREVTLTVGGNMQGVQILDDQGREYQLQVRIGTRVAGSGYTQSINGTFVPRLATNVEFIAFLTSDQVDARSMTVIVRLEGTQAAAVLRGIPIAK